MGNNYRKEGGAKQENLRRNYVGKQKGNSYLREGMNKRARPVTPNRTCTHTHNSLQPQVDYVPLAVSRSRTWRPLSKIQGFQHLLTLLKLAFYDDV